MKRKSSQAEERKQRLAKALKANLAKRKEAAKKPPKASPATSS